MEKNNINLIFNEIGFTSVCKEGFIKYISDGQRREFYLSKMDVLEILEHSSLNKENTIDSINIVINIDKEIIKEIVKRSPMYSNILD